MTRFSEAFGITRSSDDDWFDPHLTIDTKLFIDPLLLVLAGGPWAAAHERLLMHLSYCYELVARSRGSDSVSARVARRLLTFPEPAEFGLGYTAAGVAGSGSGAGLAGQMADGIAVAIALGLDEPEHLEEIGILNEGIGADRISDAVCNVLKADFISYTQAVCARHKVPMEMHKIINAQVAPADGRWLNRRLLLPTNPASGKPIILVPAELLNELPILNADDWFDSSLNQDIRDQLNLGVGRRVSKANIVRFARLHPDRVRAWARSQTSRTDLSGYDFTDDPKGVVQWDGLPARWALAHPLSVASAPANASELYILVDEVLGQYRHFIEDQRGWALLWNSDGSEKPEEAAQLVFLGLAQPYLRLFGVELDREVELGRGPVDFKVAAGTHARMLIEIKKTHNGRFWNGLEDQLTSYLKSDACEHGEFVAIRYRGSKASANRMSELPDRVAKAAVECGRTLRFTAIDARKPPSASKI